MKIVIFNINGVCVWIEILIGWFVEVQLDVVVLQEIKMQDEGFFVDFIVDLGYNIEMYGQKGFNGVVILLCLLLEDVMCGLFGDDSDEQFCYIEVMVVGYVVICIVGLYLLNGNLFLGLKFDYKLVWMEWLCSCVDVLCSSEILMIMLGDFNVIFELCDVVYFECWLDDVLFQFESCVSLCCILYDGWIEVVCLCDFDVICGFFIFWDYQVGVWQKDNGICIDYILLLLQVVDLLVDFGIDCDECVKDKFSDYVLVWVMLDV